MQSVSRSAFTLAIAATLGACGGGSISNPPSTSQPGAAMAPNLLALSAGTSYTMPANTAVLAPPGTTVSSPTAYIFVINRADENIDVQAAGGTVTLSDFNSTVDTMAGAVVTVPVNATGGAYNIITTQNGQTDSPLNISLITGLPDSNMKASLPPPVTVSSLSGGGHLVVDGSGNLIASDGGALKQVTQAGAVTLLSGADQPDDWEGIAIDVTGDIYGSGPSSGFVSNTAAWGASINELSASGQLQTLFSNWETSTSNSGVGFGGLARDSKGNLFLADGANNRIVKFTPGGSWEVFAGSGVAGDQDGLGTAATFNFNSQTGVAIDANDNMFVKSGIAIRRIAPDGTVTTVTSQLTPYTGAIAIDPSGNLYVAGYETIYRVDSATGNITPLSFLITTDPVSAMVCDSSGNLYLGTRGLGAQIFKVSF